MTKILIIDNYDSFTFNLYQIVQSLVNSQVDVYRNDEIKLDDVAELEPTHIILSPGPGHPSIDKDIGVCKDIITNYDQLNCSMLGVCLGHQAIAYCLGGEVVSAPEIVHGKTSHIDIMQDSLLFSNLPNPFTAMRYHSLIVSDRNFPDELEVVARETSKNLIMAFQHTKKSIYGIQFHPESIGTPEGGLILRNFIEKCQK